MQSKQLNHSGETQLSRTDPDARIQTKGKQHTVDYNTRSTANSLHKLFIHKEVTNTGKDSQQLSRQATAVLVKP